MPRGASPKREREYETLKAQFKREHRYPGRETEGAARIVNRQRQALGETKRERAKDRTGKSPDRSLPIEHYQHLTASQVSAKLPRLSPPQLQRIERYEAGHKRRKGVLQAIRREMK
jgi:hypothetical protein